MQAVATAVDARCGLFNLAYELECGAGVLATHVRVLDFGSKACFALTCHRLI